MKFQVQNENGMYHDTPRSATDFQEPECERETKSKIEEQDRNRSFRDHIPGPTFSKDLRKILGRFHILGKS